MSRIQADVGRVRRSECPYHPRPKHRECHHIGRDFVTVYWDDGFSDWLVTYGRLDHRGSITALATPEEVEYQIAHMQRNATASATCENEPGKAEDGSQ